jgi:hypothetical protein
LVSEFYWQAYKFDGVGEDHWNTLNNQKLFFDSLALKLNINTFEDWYSIRFSDVTFQGGDGLLHQYYNNSLSKALLTVYPDHPWQIWKFAQGSQELWEQPKHQRAFLDWLGATHFDIKQPADWYKVRPAAVRDHSGAVLLSLHSGSLLKAVKAIYPGLLSLALCSNY